MKRMRYFCFVIAVALLTLNGGFCTDTYAAYATGIGFVNIFYCVAYHPIAESYSLVSPIDDYQFVDGYQLIPGYPSYDPAYAYTCVSTPSGEASSWAIAPNFLAGQAVVQADAETHDTHQARAWAGAKGTGMIPYYTGMMEFRFYYGYELDLPPDSDGYVQFYVAFWEGSPEGANLLLTPKNEWSLVNLGTDPAPLYVLSTTLDSGADSGSSTSWFVPYVAGREYSFYAFRRRRCRHRPRTSHALAARLRRSAFEKKKTLNFPREFFLWQKKTED